MDQATDLLFWCPGVLNFRKNKVNHKTPQTSMAKVKNTYESVFHQESLFLRKINVCNRTPRTPKKH